MTTLNQLQKGELAIVDKLLNDPLTPRLIDMGFYEGQTVEMLFRAPLGDPLAVEVGEVVLSLRKEEASLIVISGRK